MDMKKKPILKRVGALLGAFLVFGVCLFSINIQSYAVDVDGYPENIPNNLFLLNVSYISGSGFDSFCMQLPLSMDDVTDSSGRWNIRDIDANIVGTYYISYADGLLTYNFRWNYDIIDVYIDANNLLCLPQGTATTLLKFTADQPFEGGFSADTFHIQRSLEDTTLSQTVVAQPISTDFPTLSADTFATVNLTASNHDIFIEHYRASFARVNDGEPFSQFTIVVPSELWDHTDNSLSNALKNNLDFEQAIAEEIVVSEFPTNWFDWIIEVVGSFFDFEFAPGFSFGTLFIGVVGILLFMFFIHVFKG